MFYIKLENDESLVVTAKEPIYRGENLNQKIIYLLPAMIDDFNIKNTKAYLNYVRADGIPNVVQLEDTGEQYNERYYQYTLPIDCKLTNAAGNVCTWLHFISNSSEQIVAKSGECVLIVEDTKDIGDYIEDDTVLPDLQDRVAFTEVNIDKLKEDAHSHMNLEVLSDITAEDIEKWSQATLGGGNLPVIGDNGNWFTWDAEQKEYIDTGVSANGQDGKSAYEVATENGFEGSIDDWLNSLIGQIGENGVAGKSAYEIAVAGGYEGTEAEWLASLQGKTGADGKDGANGKDGVDGKSAYEIAIAEGFKGSQEDWLVSLKGKNGVSGVYVGAGEMPEGYNVQIDPTEDVSSLVVDIKRNEDNSFTVSYTDSTSKTIPFPAGSSANEECSCNQKMVIVIDKNADDEHIPTAKAVVDVTGDLSDLLFDADGGSSDHTPRPVNLVHASNALYHLFSSWGETVPLIISSLKEDIGDRTMLSFVDDEGTPFDLVTALNVVYENFNILDRALLRVIGNSEELTTEDKSTLVAAINEVNGRVGDIDTALDNIIVIQEGLIGGGDA